jgi:hypothetical protein
MSNDELLKELRQRLLRLKSKASTQHMESSMQELLDLVEEEWTEGMTEPCGLHEQASVNYEWRAVKFLEDAAVPCPEGEEPDAVGVYKLNTEAVDGFTVHDWVTDCLSVDSAKELIRYMDGLNKPQAETCPDCEGTGDDTAHLWPEGFPSACQKCDGTGVTDA